MRQIHSKYCIIVKNTNVLNEVKRYLHTYIYITLKLWRDCRRIMSQNMSNYITYMLYRTYFCVRVVLMSSVSRMFWWVNTVMYVYENQSIFMVYELLYLIILSCFIEWKLHWFRRAWLQRQFKSCEFQIKILHFFKFDTFLSVIFIICYLFILSIIPH